ncbi:hypothetical protein BVRB_9g212300 [Beta vulgaris subsp. vulgaris]|nr:hypothetical protein BVRB_9g212300 [Beta vulgaris subsp. vulgaris]
MGFKNVIRLLLVAILAASTALIIKSQNLDEIANSQLIHSLQSEIAHRSLSETRPRQPARVVQTRRSRRRPRPRTPPAPQRAPVRAFFAPPSPPCPPYPYR